MSYDFRYEVADGIATITFDRPEVLNALTLEIYAQLRDLFEALRYDQAAKVVLLTGAGRGFCSGGDVHSIIGALLEQDTKAHLEFTRMTGAVVQNMRLLNKPIIAALNGMTAGAGAVLARCWRGGGAIVVRRCTGAQSDKARASTADSSPPSPLRIIFT